MGRQQLAAVPFFSTSRARFAKRCSATQPLTLSRVWRKQPALQNNQPDMALTTLAFRLHIGYDRAAFGHICKITIRASKHSAHALMSVSAGAPAHSTIAVAAEYLLALKHLFTDRCAWVCPARGIFISGVRAHELAQYRHHRSR